MSVIAIATVLAALVSEPRVQDEPETTLPEIVVSARIADEETARQFVEAVSVSPPHANSLATWQTPLCLRIVNLSSEVTRVLSAQIEGRAANLGIEVQRPGCQPNVTVVATGDGAATAASMVESFPRAFKASTGPTQLDERALQRFMENDAPVRWWNISALYDTGLKKIAVPFDGAPAPQRRSLPMAFFSETELQALLSVVVVVDARQTSDVPLTALGDFIAFVVLAEVDASTDFSAYPSILNIFRGSSDTTEMSEWDRRYLAGLYAAPVRSRNSRYQRNEIARRMIDPARSTPPTAAQ